MTKTQAATLARIIQLTSNGEPLDVTFGGIAGVNRTALWSLEDMGAITVERIPGPAGRLTMLARVA